MSDSTNNANLGRPAVATTASGSGATQLIASPTPGPSRTPNNGAPTARGFNAVPSTLEPTRRVPQQPKLSKTYQEGGQVLPNSRAELEAYGHHGPSQSGNGNYNNSNPVDPDESAQHRERARSLQGSQLLSLNQANPIGQAQPNSVTQTLPKNEVAQTTPNSVPQTMSNSVPQTMHQDCTPIAVLETTNSAPEANTLAPEPNTLAQEPNTLAPQAVTFIGVEFLNHINTSNNSDQLSMIRNDDNLDEAMGDVDP
jgi:hypothetical protein